MLQIIDGAGKEDELADLILTDMVEQALKKGTPNLELLRNISLNQASEITFFRHLAFLGEIAIGYSLGSVEHIEEYGSLKEIFYSKGIFVLPNFRRRGYGTKLKEHQMEFARTSGFRVSVSEVSSDNVASIAMLKKNGFDFIPRKCDGATTHYEVIRYL